MYVYLYKYHAFFTALLLTLCCIFLPNTARAFDPGTPLQVSEEDGDYSIDVSLTGGSGKASIESPTRMTVRDGKAYARITWSSSNYDYMIVGDHRYDNLSEENLPSSFEIPIAAFDTEIPVIADTTAMGVPHEIEYTLNFASDSFGPASDLPREAAKRVVLVALAIIVIGGILNHFVKKRYYV